MLLRDYKEANLLISDSLINYKTVQSFGRNEVIIKKLDEHVTKPLNVTIAYSHKIAIAFGLSQFMRNCVSAILYLAAAEILFANPE